MFIDVKMPKYWSASSSFKIYLVFSYIYECQLLEVGFVSTGFRSVISGIRLFFMLQNVVSYIVLVIRGLTRTSLKIEFRLWQIKLLAGDALEKQPVMMCWHYFLSPVITWLLLFAKKLLDDWLGTLNYQQLITLTGRYPIVFSRSEKYNSHSTKKSN